MAAVRSYPNDTYSLRYNFTNKQVIMLKVLYQPIFRYTFKYSESDDDLVTLHSSCVYTDPEKAVKCARDIWSAIKGEDDILKEILIKKLYIEL